MGRSVTDPFYWIALYTISVKNQTMGTDDPTNEMLDLFRQWGGELVTKVGLDPRRVEKVKRSAIRHGRKHVDPMDRIYEIAGSPIDLARQVVTISDVGPRLAEFAGVLRSHGFEFDRESGKILNTDPDVNAFERPPRHVLVEAINAAADVTINY